MPDSTTLFSLAHFSLRLRVRQTIGRRATMGVVLLGLVAFSPALLAAERADASAAAAAADTGNVQEAATTALLAGEWTVDLRPSLADPTYTQPMVLVVAKDGTVSGSFYQSDILGGRAGRGQGRVCVAFRTTDGAGLYHSAACLVDGKLVGQTWAEHRNFVLPWTAVPKLPDGG